MNLLRLPDHAHLILEDSLKSFSVGAEMRYEDCAVTISSEAAQIKIEVKADKTPLRGIHFRWNEPVPAGALRMRDAWGRQDADQAWAKPTPHEAMPWFFMLACAEKVAGIGVRTNPNCFASWQMDAEGVSLFLDTRNGNKGVVLGGRSLELASIVSAEYPTATHSAFEATRAFCREMVTETPRATGETFYGGNNWYYAYGDITEQSCLDDAKRVAEWSTGLSTRPYMLIDDGWQVAQCDNRYNSGPRHVGNRRFPDLAGLAQAMKDVGTRPGIWYRPLVTIEGHMEAFRIRNDRKPPYSEAGYAMDPTFPQVRERLLEDAQRLKDWGYELIKHDFSTVDLLGSWLNTFEGCVAASSAWGFHDNSKTNAEIVKDLYALIMKGAGDARIIGCQTVGHLGVGTIDLQRTGGDVSGRDWERTRRMGPNSLAFRQPQHDIFFQCDADCAPLIPDVPEFYTFQWAELLAKSGTPLFVSADPRSLDDKTSGFVREMLTIAESHPSLAEPLDWMETPSPRVWKFGENTRSFDWAPKIGCGPEGLIPGDPVCLLEK